jgi:hypothetical protein
MTTASAASATTAACTAAQRPPPNASSGDLQLSIVFADQSVALRPSAEDGLFHVWFSRYRIAEVDLRTNPDRPGVTHLFEHL